jgi:hypothetical protein
MHLRQIVAAELHRQVWQAQFRFSGACSFRELLRVEPGRIDYLVNTGKPQRAGKSGAQMAFV